LAEQQQRQEKRSERLQELKTNQIYSGVVKHLTNFGAFVDLGEIDGLIHISELSWRRVNHPREVIQVGDEIQVLVLAIDHDRQRITLSLKQLQTNPWEVVEEIYTTGQIVSGRVNKVVKFGAFVELDIGIEGLLHVSEIADPTPHDPRDFVEPGEEIKVYIQHIDASRQRISLSLKHVPEWATSNESE
jgi:ribosomal protein S1